MLKTIKKFFEFAASRAGLMKLGLVTAIINAIFSALQILALAIVLKALVEHSVTFSTVWISLGVMSISVLGSIVMGYISRLAETKGAFLMCADHRINIGDRMKYMPMGFFNKNSLGQITTVVTSTMEDIQDIGPVVIERSLHGFIETGMIILFLIFYDWRIGLIAIVGIIVFSGINTAMQRKSRKISPRKLAAQTSLVSAVLEYVQGMSVVKAFNTAGNARRKIDEAISENEKMFVSLEFSFLPFLFLQMLILKLSSVVIIASSIVFYFSGMMELHRCLLMLIVAFMIYSKLEMAGLVSALMRVIDMSIDKVNDIYSSPLMDIDGQVINPENLNIEGKNVGFSYEEKKIIDNVSFSIPQGTTTAFVGPSGGGKTTLCNLIARFWDVDEGEITLGGVNLKDYTLDSLLANISLVFQNVYLFQDTIANNIKFGKPEATMEEIKEAAQKACCHDFIIKLPDGYDTIIGEGGATISGGERQRISIARAILKDAPIIMFDEATANVDPENESELQSAIMELTRSKTIIMIAHRLKTVRHADQIMVLEDGKIIQQGNHDQLFNKGGLYRDFINIREESLGWRIEG